MEQWLWFPWSLLEYAGMHEIHVIIDCCAAHRCAEVQALGDELGIRLHLLPPA
jgi:hypothetical protein